MRRGLALAAIAAATLAPGASVRAQEEICFGAVARDPVRACSPSPPPHTVVPMPAVARALPWGGCQLGTDGPLVVCTFGVPREDAAATIALIGDSHASHWRAALLPLTEARRWHGISISQSGCPLSTAVRRLRLQLQQKCGLWKRNVIAWLRRHPEVRTIFTSQASGQRMLARRGADRLRVQVEGFRTMWRKLPESVEHVIVLRDTPKAGAGTAACIERAVATGAEPGSACRLVRAHVLDRDAQAVAAYRMPSPRFRVIDLTRFFCDARYCYPVVGGVLVHRDEHHLTATFMRTLAPYLLQRVVSLLPV